MNFCRVCGGEMVATNFQGPFNEISYLDSDIKKSFLILTPNMVNWVCSDCDWVKYIYQH